MSDFDCTINLLKAFLLIPVIIKISPIIFIFHRFNFLIREAEMQIVQKILFQLFFGFIILIMLTNSLYATTNYDTQIDDPLGPLNRFKHKFEKIGITYTRMGESIAIIIDEKKTLGALPILTSEGIVSKLDVEAVNISPLSISVVIAGISSTITILNSVFERNEHLDKVHVIGYVIPIGQTTKNPCYSFDYDRNKFRMLDLAILTPRIFISTTPNFTFSDWCKQNLDKEPINLIRK